MNQSATEKLRTKKIAIIGGGPAGLMAAETLSAKGIHVCVFDAMPTMGRKFLLAGIGGLNITHAEPKTDFMKRYGKREHETGHWLSRFDADDVRDWVHGLGIETFVGTSQRVFPKEMKAAPLLRSWLRRLKAQGVVFHQRHRFMGWNANNELRFSFPDGEKQLGFDATLLALGGGSWPRLGSDGAWTLWLEEKGVHISPLLPANCGFECGWSAYFQEHHAGTPLKSVIAKHIDIDGKEWRREGECIVTQQGIEASLIYALSAPLRDTISEKGEALLELDLVPYRTEKELTRLLSRPRGKNSLSNHWRKVVGIEGVKAALLREALAPQACLEPERVAKYLKAFPLVLQRPRPLAEAISSAGGVNFSSVTDGLMLSAMPGTFCAGEMLDWEAPTGGYLLTACLASGVIAAEGMIEWLTTS